MGGFLPSEIRRSLAASRLQADRVLIDAQARARELSVMASETDRALATARIERIAGLRAEIADHQNRIELAYVAMVEAMAHTAVLLAEVARNAEFDPPSWPDGIRTLLEIKVVETRELTIRLARGGMFGGAWNRESRMPPDGGNERQERQ